MVPGRAIAAVVVAMALIGGFSTPAGANSRSVSLSTQEINLPPAHMIVPIALNDAGQTLMGTAACTDCPPRYYFWSQGVYTQIGSPRGITSFQPYALDDDGSFVGFGAVTSAHTPTVKSYLGRVQAGRTSFTKLLDPNGNPNGVEALAMNAVGDVLGQSNTVPSDFYFWSSGNTRGRVLQLPPVKQGTTTVSKLDDAGDFGGLVQTGKGTELVIWLAGSSPLILPRSFVPSSSGADAMIMSGLTASLNNTQVYVTAYQQTAGPGVHPISTYWIVNRQTWSHPAAATGPFFTGRLSPNDKAAQATGVSAGGWVIGDSIGTGARAFLFHSGKLSPIRKLITAGQQPAPSVFTEAPTAINDRNQMLLGYWLFTPLQ